MNILSFILSMFTGKSVLAQKPVLYDALDGLSIDYLIGNSNIQKGREGRLTVVAYDINVLPRYGVGAGYCNLFEEDFTGKYGPYLNSSDTAHGV